MTYVRAGNTEGAIEILDELIREHPLGIGEGPQQAIGAAASFHRAKLAAAEDNISAAIDTFEAIRKHTLRTTATAPVIAAAMLAEAQLLVTRRRQHRDALTLLDMLDRDYGTVQDVGVRDSLRAALLVKARAALELDQHDDAFQAAEKFEQIYLHRDDLPRLPISREFYAYLLQRSRTQPEPRLEKLIESFSEIAR
ncbi:MAG TPA: tetratricopeptide repeat protein [Thermoanaerobaculia bacterium]|nr:tetratricopeptide repeat protein [Thermoanaerobaculia bacterium]